MSYQIDQGGEVRIYDNDQLVYQTERVAGTYTYTYEKLTVGRHALGVDISNANGQGSDTVLYTALKSLVSQVRD